MKPYKFIVILAVVVLISCASAQTSFAPKEILKDYVSAIKEKNLDKIKELSSEKTIKMMEDGAKDQGITLEDAVKQNEPVIPPILEDPEIRNINVKGSRATVEIKNRLSGSWIEFLFVKEDGKWKVGAGDMFEEAFEKFRDTDN